MLERQREGVAKAKADGRYKGREPTARNQSEEIVTLAKAGMTRLRIAETLDMSERSVYRVLSSGARERDAGKPSLRA
jgi:DNA invertase Pin-like site-specific DNA recombinase